MFLVAESGRWGRIAGFEAAGIFHGFSTRRGGVSDGPYESLNVGFFSGDDRSRVLANRERLFRDWDWPLERAVFGRQVHGAKVVQVGGGHGGAGARVAETALPETDALVTDVPDLALAVMGADCAPVFLVDPHRPAVGLVHAGWRGTVGDAVAETVRTMINAFGSRPATMVAAIGPAIGPCCYEVGHDVAEAFRSAGLEAALTSGDHGRFRLDLTTALRLQVQALGIPPSHVATAGVCTSCRQDLFFSHRRDGGVTGRMIGMIGLRRPGP